MFLESRYSGETGGQGGGVGEVGDGPEETCGLVLGPTSAGLGEGRTLCPHPYNHCTTCLLSFHLQPQTLGEGRQVGAGT